MKILKRSGSYIDMLFTAQEIEDYFESASLFGDVVDAIFSIAVNKGVIKRDEHTAMLIFDGANVTIARCIIRGHMEIDDSLKNDFVATIDEYMRKYGKYTGRYVSDTEPLEKSLYGVIKANNISEFRPIVDLYPKRKRASLYKYKGKYLLVCNLVNMEQSYIKIREFDTLEVYNDLEISHIKEHGELIVENKALNIIKTYY